MSEQKYAGLELWPETMEAKQLFILLHGIGSQASDLVALADDLMDEFPTAGFFLPEGFYPFDGGGNGRQWYSNLRINDESRVERVAAEMAAMRALIKYTQQRFNVLQSDTALVGFSQGAHVALQYSVQHDGHVGRVIAFSGRFPALPDKAPELTTIHLLHGEDDDVVSASHAQAAYDRLKQIEGDVTLDILPGIGHEIPTALSERAIHRLKTTIPMRTWKEAMKGA